MERFAEKDLYKNVNCFRNWKSAKVWGEWFVIVGIVIEVVVGSVTAISQWRADPMKKPIASASARARIIFKLSEKQTDRELLEPFFKPGPDDAAGWTAEIKFASGTNGLLVLEARQMDVAIWIMGSDIEKECRILLKEDPFDFLESESDRNIPVNRFDDVDSFILYVAELPTNVVVVTGNVYLTVNDSKWTFDIPPQKPKWGLITMQKTTDKNGNPQAEILRVPISDFVYPPRFTNRWYDGK